LLKHITVLSPQPVRVTTAKSPASRIIRRFIYSFSDILVTSHILVTSYQYSHVQQTPKPEAQDPALVPPINIKN
jgi:hypothetical protein